MSVTWENPGVRPQNWNLQAEAGITHDDVPDDDRSSEPKVEIGFLSRPAAVHQGNRFRLIFFLSFELCEIILIEIGKFPSVFEAVAVFCAHSSDRGHLFHAIVGACSRASWAAVP